MPADTMLNGKATNGSAASKVIRVAIVDDHPAICYALSEIIRRTHGFELCGEADSVDAARELFEAHAPDVAAIDIALPDGDGLDLVKLLVERRPELAVVVFSMYEERIYAERAIRAGARGYVMKSEPTKTVIKALRAVTRGDVYLSARIASKILVKLASREKSCSDSSLESLTDREMSVFRMLANGHTVKEIAGKLGLNPKTVETYRRRAKEKLGFSSTAQLLQFAVRWAYGQPSAPPPNGQRPKQA